VDLREGLVVALDPAGGRVRRYVRTEHTCGYGVDFAGGALWVADGLPLNALTRRDPRTGATLATTPTIGGPQSGPCAVTAAAGSIWVGTSFGVYRVDTRHVRVAARIDAGEDTQSTLVAAGDRLWVGDDVADGLRELDARSGRTLAIYRFGGGSVAIGAGRVWATGGRWASTPAGRIPTLVEIDPRIERVVGRYRVGRRDPGFVGERTPQEVDWPFVVQRVLSGAGLADGSLWIHQNAERRLYRIDPRP
jgi:outer membrane protein assembly factor BamB